jgi:hypothetical protein
MSGNSAKRLSGQDMLQPFDLARFLIVRTIPLERETRWSAMRKSGNRLFAPVAH